MDVIALTAPLNEREIAMLCHGARLLEAAIRAGARLGNDGRSAPWCSPERRLDRREREPEPLRPAATAPGEAARPQEPGP